MGKLAVIAALAPSLATLGCSGANPSSGQTAYLQVQDAQFIAGPIDTQEHANAPTVSGVTTLSNDVFFPGGSSGKSISGSVGPGSTAVLLGLQGDNGHWVVPVEAQDQTLPGNFTFSCNASFSAQIPTNDAGTFNLIVRATDIHGNMGPVRLQPMRLAASIPQGALVISLDWDTEADLDLHVQLPGDVDAGVNEIWSRKPSGLPAGTQGASADDGMAAGYLDFDSNGQCVIDGRREENVIFPSSPPNGHYRVLVDTFSLCGQATARWRVQIFTNGMPTGIEAYGQSTETDTRFPHGQGAGVQALVFDNQ
jgi:hypothetical protein